MTVVLVIVGVLAFLVAPLVVIGAGIGWLIAGPVGALIGGGLGVLFSCN